MKKLAIVFITLTISGVVAYYLLNQRSFSLFYEDSPAYHAVPLDVPLFIEISSIRAIPVRNQIIAGMKNAGLRKSLFSTMTRLDSIISSHPEIPSALKNDRMTIALKHEGRDELTPLFIVPLTGNNRKKGWRMLVNSWYPDTQFTTNTRGYDHVSIHDIADPSSRPVFAYAFDEGLFLASPKSALVEQAIRQLHSGSLSGNQTFIRVNRTASSQTVAAIYVNHLHLPQFLARWLSSEPPRTVNEFGETELIRYSREISNASDYAGWTELDLSLNDRGFRLTGVSMAYDSLNQYLSVFGRQQPQRLQADRLLPANTCMYVSYTISDPQAFFNDLERYLKGRNKFYAREEKFTRILSESRTNLKSVLQDILDKEIILAHMPTAGRGSEKSGVLVIPVKNRSSAEGQILQMLKTRAERRGQSLSDFEVTLDAAKQVYAYKFPYPSLPGIWLGFPFRSVKANFVGFYLNNLVFASSGEELNRYLAMMQAGETLSRDMRYQRFMQNADSKANISVYADLSCLSGLSGELFSTSVARDLERNKDYLSRFRQMNWQVVQIKGAYFNNLMVSYMAGDEPVPGVAGQVSRELPLKGRP